MTIPTMFRQLIGDAISRKDQGERNELRKLPPSRSSQQHMTVSHPFYTALEVVWSTCPGPRPGLACYSIEEKYANYGPQRPTDDQTRGLFRDFRGSAFGMARTVASQKERPGSPMPTCSVPKGETVTVDSSIYWSPKTCAHVVQGQIRTLWLQTGGARGKLGYPVDDETLTPDRLGRMSTFEHGQILWYPDKGAFVSPKEVKEQEASDIEPTLETAAEKEK
jgi:hypothetical protein